jgi:pentatricopeptide repeat protein
VSEETIVVDLDRNSLMFGEQTMELPPVPGKKWVKLRNSLNNIAGHMFWQTRGLEQEYKLLENQKMTQWNFKRVARHKGGEIWKEKLETYDQAFNLQFTPDSENLRTEDSIEREHSQWDRLQEAFLRFFVAILKDYRGFLHVPEAGTPLSPTPGANDWIKWSKRRYFDSDGFLEFQKPQYIPYLAELCSTQQFDDFITKRLYSPEMPDIIFFDQSIDAKLNRSSLRFSKVDTPFLQSAKTHKVLKSFLAVEPNSSDLPSDGPFVYKTWPETFDPTLFCKPRPIPNIITAEFDRQASLISRLRRNHSPSKDGDKELMLFYGSDFDISPEGMAFTVYFFTYSAVIGREWRDYQLKRRELNMVSNDLDPTAIEALETHQARESQAVSDLTLGVCEDCLAPQQVVLANVLDCSPCPQYADQLNFQAQEAYNVITKFAMTPYEMMYLPTSGSLLDGDEGLAEYEEAREVAVAQLDLAFDTLRAMEVRGHLSDPDIFKSLMEACGRCGDTKRALGLIEMMKRDGVADGEVLSCFMAAFCHGGDNGMDSISDGSRGSDAYSNLLRKKLEAVGGTPKAGALQGGILSDSETESAYSDFISESGSEASDSSSVKRTSSLIEWFGVTPPNNPLMKKKKKKKKKRKKKKNISEEWAVTDRLSKQIILGESLLEFLYPDLSLDTHGDACPQCSHRMTENEIVDGWLPCEFQDYTTACSKCAHRFVPKFSVSCKSSTFEGSQGLGTPLFCEFLSPWVLRKELNHIISVEDGIDVILNPEWRSGTDIQATMWWNLIAMFKRHDLPFSFLLQGSFKNRLINPVPQD